MIVPTMMLVLALVAATEAIIANKAEFKLQKIEQQFDAVVDADAKPVGKAIAVVEHKARKALNLQSPRAAPSSDITCDACVDFFDEFLNTLLNAALQVGVAGTCEELCSYIPNQYGQVFCDLVCLGVGLDEFINLLNDSDLDPIFLCSELDACPADTCGPVGCTTITNVVVSPNPGKLRSTFTFSITLRANKNTGTGITGVAMNCPNCNQQGQLFWATLNEGFSAGQTYTINSTLDTSEMDWTYPIGQVQYQAVSCRYDCGDGSQNSQNGYIWSDWNGTFVIKQ